VSTFEKTYYHNQNHAHTTRQIAAKRAVFASLRRRRDAMRGAQVGALGARSVCYNADDVLTGVWARRECRRFERGAHRGKVKCRRDVQIVPDS
jgi:hypothetical protein